jgi:hypothetical protein
MGNCYLHQKLKKIKNVSSIIGLIATNTFLEMFWKVRKLKTEVILGNLENEK